jgi:hypothetical protein
VRSSRAIATRTTSQAQRRLALHGHSGRLAPLVRVTTRAGPRHWAVDVKSRTERRAFLRVARTLAASHSGRARAPRCGHSTYGSRLLLLSHARGRAQRPQVEPAHGASARPLRHRFGAARTALAVLKNGCLASKQSHGVSFRLGATDNRSGIAPDPCIQDPIRRDAKVRSVLRDVGSAADTARGQTAAASARSAGRARPAGPRGLALLELISARSIRS